MYGLITRLTAHPGRRDELGLGVGAFADVHGLERRDEHSVAI